MSGVDVSYESFFGKMGNAMCGVCVGFLLIPISFYIIGKNEMNAVCTRKSYDDAKKQMVETACTYSRQNDAKFIHFSCDVDPSNLNLTSSDTGAKSTAFTMTATSYQYQWKQEKKSKSVDSKAGGGTYTYDCYCFEKAWSSTFNTINTGSTQCNGQEGLSCPGGQQSPSTNAAWTGSGVTGSLTSETTTASKVNLKKGGSVQYEITQAQIPSISGSVPSAAITFSGTAPTNFAWDSTSQQFYWGNGGGSLSGPQVNDRKIIFSARYADMLSAVGTQSTSGGVGHIIEQEFGGSTIPPCDKRTVLYIEGGNVSGDKLFENLKEALKVLTWILRLVSFLMLFFGFFLIVAPLSVAPDIIPCVGPCIGDLVGSLLCVCSCCTALVVWTVVVGMCWMFARPALGGAMLAVGALIGGLAFWFKKKKDSGESGGDTGASYDAMV